MDDRAYNGSIAGARSYSTSNVNSEPGQVLFRQIRLKLRRDSSGSGISVATYPSVSRKIVSINDIDAIEAAAGPDSPLSGHHFKAYDPLFDSGRLNAERALAAHRENLERLATREAQAPTVSVESNPYPSMFLNATEDPRPIQQDSDRGSEETLVPAADLGTVSLQPSQDLEMVDISEQKIGLYEIDRENQSSREQISDLRERSDLEMENAEAL